MLILKLGPRYGLTLEGCGQQQIAALIARLNGDLWAILGELNLGFIKAGQK